MGTFVVIGIAKRCPYFASGIYRGRHFERVKIESRKK